MLKLSGINQNSHHTPCYRNLGILIAESEGAGGLFACFSDFVPLHNQQGEGIRAFGSLKHIAYFEASNTALSSIHSLLKETICQTDEETESVLHHKWFCILSIGKEMSEIWGEGYV